MEDDPRSLSMFQGPRRTEDPGRFPWGFGGSGWGGSAVTSRIDPLAEGWRPEGSAFGPQGVVPGHHSYPS